MAITTTAVPLDANRDTSWSIPPVTGDAPVQNDISLTLTQGVIYKMEYSGILQMQNTSRNEKETIEFSKHGDPDGSWGVLQRNAFLEIENNFYLLNRSHRENCIITIF